FAVLEPLHTLTDSFVGKAAYPKTGEGLVTTQVMIDVTEDKFAFATGISGTNYGLGFIKQPFDNCKLFDCSGIVLVLLAILYLARNKLKTLRKDRKILSAETFKAIDFGHGKPHQMTEAPCNGIAVTFHISVFAVFGSHYQGNIPCHTRFLCNNYFHDISF